MQNSLPFNEQALLEADFSLKTKARSLTFGRRLYQFETASSSEMQQPSLYWLKTQQNLGDGSEQSVLGFQRELSMYQMLRAQGAKFLLPFQIVPADQFNHCIPKACNQPALILPHAPSVLDQRAEQLSIVQIKMLFMQLAETLDALAQLGWLHSDIKKEHFVAYQGQVRLIDFEQALSIETLSSAPMNATPRYMAPELFQGQAKSIHSEIYAFGIVLLEWLTGQRLHAKNYEDWAYLHCQHLNIDLSQHFLCFQPLLQSMLAKQKNQRICGFSQIKTRLMTEIV